MKGQLAWNAAAKAVAMRAAKQALEFAVQIGVVSEWGVHRGNRGGKCTQLVKDVWKAEGKGQLEVLEGLIAWDSLVARGK